VPLSELDRNLLANCFEKRPFAWESFVDRYLNLVMYVVQQTARRRNIELQPSDETEFVNDVFLTILKDDFALLRRFAGNCSLATYLTILARRVVVRKLLRQRRHVANRAQ
jgi:RNA polymerase sigma-70 factor (ECF subfamily)